MSRTIIQLTNRNPVSIDPGEWERPISASVTTQLPDGVMGTYEISAFGHKQKPLWIVISSRRPANWTEPALGEQLGYLVEGLPIFNTIKAACENIGAPAILKVLILSKLPPEVI